MLATAVIGNSSSSFYFVLPQTILYCTLRGMKADDKIAAQAQAYELSSQPTICTTKSEATSFNGWHHVLVELHYSNKVEFKRQLVKKYEEHSILPKPGETTMEYIPRHGQ